MDDTWLVSLFEKLLNESSEKNLGSREERRKLVERITIEINVLALSGFATDENGCKSAVAAIITHHRKTIGKNGADCIFRKHHNLLYVAVKLCFDFKLTGPIVADLLKDIFRCEKSFQRIFGGALYGVTASHFTISWKSDFRDQEENIMAVGYFLQEAATQRLLFPVQVSSGRTKMRKLPDVSMSPFETETPLMVALQIENPEMVLLLLRFDSSVPFEFLQIYLKGSLKSHKGLKCVRMLFRAAPSISGLGRKRGSRYEDWLSFKMATSLGLIPPQLKHLCRCQIRNCLRMNSTLPFGIAELKLPKILSDYLDLLFD